MNKFGISVLAIAGFLLFAIWSTYSSIVAKDEGAIEAWGNVESTYQRRSDLIPNLVKVVKQYADHENETLVAVTEMRASVGQIQISPEMLSDPEQLAKFQAAQGELGSVLMRLMAVAESYPDLKANVNFLKLQDQLEGTENRINVARQDYNSSVKSFNQSIRGPFGSLVNAMFTHLDRRSPFEAQAGSEIAPEVNFD